MESTIPQYPARMNVQELTGAALSRTPQAEARPLIPKVRTLIVDDESLARRSLRRCLTQFPVLEVVGESDGGAGALAAIHAMQPELVFLDVEMPGVSGLDVASKLKGTVPVIVFVTGYDRYALDAFRAHALDYILKPLDEGRIAEVVERVVEQIRLRRLEGLEQRFQAAVQQLERRGNGTDGGASRQNDMQKLAVKENGRIRLLEVASIDWIEACGNYVTLHIGTSRHLIRETMNTMESRLDPSSFLRIHRSTMVNLRSVVELRPGLNGSYLVVLSDQTKLVSSRGYHGNVELRLAAMR